MAALVLMIGVPGSGKSTWIQNRLTPNDVWVSRDAIRYSLLEEDDDYFAKEDEVIKLFIQGVDDMLQEPNIRYIYADATHLSPKSRNQILNNLKTKPDVTYAVFIDTPLELALARNSYREGRAVVPEQVIRRMYKSISLPTKAEKIDTIFFVDEDGEIDGSRTRILEEE